MLSETEAVGRMALAIVAGGAMGFERGRLAKPAGIRTYALVCLGATLFMVGSIMLGDDVREQGGMAYDPSRIGSTIVQGIGFLAAGVIFTTRGRVRGLTTAAGIWVAAAIGLLIGAGFYVTAFAAAFLTVLTLTVFRRFEVWADIKDDQGHLIVDE